MMPPNGDWHTSLRTFCLSLSSFAAVMMDAAAHRRFFVPLWTFYLVGLAYYAGGAAVLCGILVYVNDRRGKIASLTLIIIVMLLNELWNYLFFGLRSTLAGFLR